MIARRRTRRVLAGFDALLRSLSLDDARDPEPAEELKTNPG